MAQQIWTGKKVWVTGASTGIGRGIAELLIGKGATVAISARSEDKLQELVSKHPGYVFSVPFDVMEKPQHKDAIEKVIKELGGIDVVILNAGDCKYIDIDNFSSEPIEYMQKINFISMAYSLEYLLPYLKKSKSPQIVAISSSAAYLGFPRAEAYGASKAAIKYFFESFRADVAKYNINVSVIFPGFVKTPLTDKNDFKMPMRISVEKAAKDIVKGIEKKKKEIVTPFMFVTMIKILSYLPISLKNKLLMRMVDK